MTVAFGSIPRSVASPQNQRALTGLAHPDHKAFRGRADRPTVLAKSALGVAGALFLVAALGRGLFEGVLPKLQAYTAQFVLVSLAVLVLILFGGATPRRNGRSVTWLAYGAVLTILISSLTSAIASGRAGLVYASVSSYYVALLWLFATFRFTHVRFWMSIRKLRIALILLALVALGQQFLGLFAWLSVSSDTFSVAGYIRPASTTGSYLHYPLALAVLIFPLLQQVKERRRENLGPLILGLASLTVSLSRSGLLLLVVGVATWGILQKAWRSLAVAVGLCAVLVVSPISWSSNAYVARVLSSTDLTSSGNAQRLALWQQGFDLWAESWLLLGQFTGRVTNAAANIGAEPGLVVESGLLQQMINFGLIGAIFFYAIFTCGWWVVDRRHLWLRAGIAGACVQSFVYQSIEVLPFVALVALYPAISDAIDDRHVERMTSAWKGPR